MMEKTVSFSTRTLIATLMV